MFACSSQAKLHTRGRGIMTWYSFEDNGSSVGSFDNKLKTFVSVARSHNSRVPLHARLFIPKLKGFPMENGMMDGFESMTVAEDLDASISTSTLGRMHNVIGIESGCVRVASVILIN